jgi:capsular polysaccharide biosynthesis protein
MKEYIYIIKDRGNKILFHWFIFVIGALEHISHIPKPLKFHTNITEEFQKETIKLLEPNYIYIEDYSNYNQIIVPHVELIVENLVADKYYTFIRNTILLNNPILINNNTPSRLVYISRNKSHTLECNSGLARRQIINDTEVKECLNTIGFECIYLEDYTLLEKIEIYQTSKIIVTPNGGANTIALFANKNTKIIELHDQRSNNENQYYLIGEKLGNPFIRYTNVTTVDYNGIPAMPGLNNNVNYVVNDCKDLLNFIINMNT